jgi:hypothetical protein
VETLIAWSGFFGAWLLVAGPLYQAAIELEQEDFEREEFGRIMQSLPPPPRSSPWWWLVPPVAYLRQRRQGRAYRDLILGALTPKQVEDMIRFRNKATGWLTVGAGALLIAVKETWELVGHSEWPVWVFWALLVVMAGVAALNTSLRMKRGHDMIATGKATS